MEVCGCAVEVGGWGAGGVVFGKVVLGCFVAGGHVVRERDIAGGAGEPDTVGVSVMICGIYE